MSGTHMDVRRTGRRFSYAAGPNLSKTARSCMPKRTQHLCAQCADGNHIGAHTELGCTREVAGSFICECEVRR